MSKTEFKADVFINDEKTHAIKLLAYLDGAIYVNGYGVSPGTASRLIRQLEKAYAFATGPQSRQWRKDAEKRKKVALNGTHQRTTK